MFVTIKLEDIILTAEYRPDMDQPKCDLTNIQPSMWHVIVTDELTLRTMSAKWDTNQISAVLALMMGFEGAQFLDLTKVLYKIAGPLFKDWSDCVRPIP